MTSAATLHFLLKHFNNHYPHIYDEIRGRIEPINESVYAKLFNKHTISLYKITDFFYHQNIETAVIALNGRVLSKDLRREELFIDNYYSRITLYFSEPELMKIFLESFLYWSRAIENINGYKILFSTKFNMEKVNMWYALNKTYPDPRGKEPISKRHYSDFREPPGEDSKLGRWLPQERFKTFNIFGLL